MNTGDKFPKSPLRLWHRLEGILLKMKPWNLLTIFSLGSGFLLVVIILFFERVGVLHFSVLDSLASIFTIASFLILIVIYWINLNTWNRGKTKESSEKLFSELGDNQQKNPLRILVSELLEEHLATQGREVVKAKLSSAFKQSVEDNIANLVEEGFKLQDSSKTSKEDGTAMEDALRYATTMDEKYRAQIDRLTSQQNRSLNIGLGFAFAGAMVLFVLLFVPSLNPHGEGNWDNVAGYISKALTVVFLEVFAFFFLRNYRLIFAEIKYYQQKRNDLQGKVVALRIAIASYDGDKMIERAFDAFLTMPEDKPFSKTKTTENIEQEKQFDHHQKRFYDLMEKMMDTLGGSKSAKGVAAENSEKSQDV